MIATEINMRGAYRPRVVFGSVVRPHYHPACPSAECQCPKLEVERAQARMHALLACVDLMPSGSFLRIASSVSNVLQRSRSKWNRNDRSCERIQPAVGVGKWPGMTITALSAKVSRKRWRVVRAASASTQKQLLSCGSAH